MGRCIAKTARGSRCSRTAIKGAKHCRQHFDRHVGNKRIKGNLYLGNNGKRFICDNVSKHCYLIDR